MQHHGRCAGKGPLFPGCSDIDQLCRLRSVLGSIDTQVWPAAQQLPDFAKLTFAPAPAKAWPEVLPGVSAAALDLLQHMMQYNPGAVMQGYTMQMQLPGKLLCVDAAEVTYKQYASWKELICHKEICLRGAHVLQITARVLLHCCSTASCSSGQKIQLGWPAWCNKCVSTAEHLLLISAMHDDSGGRAEVAQA